ncbi:MAG: YafY family protein [Acidimicrobiales bacterium]|jgi:predicted DNA-binding transcriptional regulator YafY
MGDTAGRMLRLLSLFQSRQNWTSMELADRLEVSDRTVRRDIDHLRELGYPVEATPGPAGGYQLGRGARIPPLLLDEDETVAVALGLHAGVDGSVIGLEDATLSALAKLERFLPAHLSTHVRDLYDATLTLWGRDADPVDRALLVVLARGCRATEAIRLDYRDRSGSATNRIVEPYRLVRTGRRWYLVAHDTGRAAWRTFRVDRIEAAAGTGQRFELVDPPDALALVAEGMGVSPYPVRTTVRFALSFEATARLIPRTVGVLTPEGSDSTIVEIGGVSLPDMVRYLAGLGTSCEVLEPLELRLALRRHCEELAARNA